MQFKKATKKEAKARIALIGPSGSGKTFSALAISSAMGQRIAVVDTEHGSASKYADVFDFDALELTNYHPKNYIEAMHLAQDAGYDVLVIDSLSHAWSGKGGVLEIKETSPGGNDFTKWRNATKWQERLVEEMLSSRCHILVTMRSKTSYVLQENEKGRQEPKKVGMAPIQRDGIDYNFDVVGELDHDHYMTITKTRCPGIDSMVYEKSGSDFASEVMTWLSDGEKDEESELGLRIRDELNRLGMENGTVKGWIKDEFDTDPDDLTLENRRDMLAKLQAMDQFILDAEPQQLSEPEPPPEPPAAEGQVPQEETWEKPELYRECENIWLEVLGNGPEELEQRIMEKYKCRPSEMKEGQMKHLRNALNSEVNEAA